MFWQSNEPLENFDLGIETVPCQSVLLPLCESTENSDWTDEILYGYLCLTSTGVQFINKVFFEGTNGDPQYSFKKL